VELFFHGGGGGWGGLSPPWEIKTGLGKNVCAKFGGRFLAPPPGQGGEKTRENQGKREKFPKMLGGDLMEKARKPGGGEVGGKGSLGKNKLFGGPFYRKREKKKKEGGKKKKNLSFLRGGGGGGLDQLGRQEFYNLFFGGLSLLPRRDVIKIVFVLCGVVELGFLVGLGNQGFFGGRPKLNNLTQLPGGGTGKNKKGGRVGGAFLFWGTLPKVTRMGGPTKKKKNRGGFFSQVGGPPREI